MRKRILSVLLNFGLLFLLCSCGAQNIQETEVNMESQISTEVQEIVENSESAKVPQTEERSFKDIYGMELPEYVTTAGQELELCPVRNGGFQVCIQNTTVEEYKQYAATLENSGFEIYSEKDIQGNLFHTYFTDNLQVFLSWNPSLNTSRIVFQEPEALPSLEKPVLNADDTVIPSVSQVKVTEGMSYVIQLADGSFILIDGGKINNKDIMTLYDFLVENTPEGKLPLIETWMLTHPDNDHIDLATKFVKTYADRVEIKSFAYNFADSTVYSTVTQEKVIADLEKNIANGYPEAVTYTLHAGQTYYYKGVEVEILLTEEDVYPSDLSKSKYNGTSAAWRMTFDNGETFLVLGDCMQKLCRQLAATYGDYLKSDILQLAHHGLIGGDLELYQFIDPAVCFWTTSEARFNGNYEEKYHYCLGEGGCDYNAWIRDETIRVREHYHNSVTTTLLMEN